MDSDALNIQYGLQVVKLTLKPVVQVFTLISVILDIPLGCHFIQSEAKNYKSNQ